MSETLLEWCYTQGLRVHHAYTPSIVSGAARLGSHFQLQAESAMRWPQQSALTPLPRSPNQYCCLGVPAQGSPQFLQDTELFGGVGWCTS